MDRIPIRDGLFIYFSSDGSARSSNESEVMEIVLSSVPEIKDPKKLELIELWIKRREEQEVEEAGRDAVTRERAKVEAGFDDKWRRSVPKDASPEAWRAAEEAVRLARLAILRKKGLLTGNE